MAVPIKRNVIHRNGVVLVCVLGLAHDQMENRYGVDTELAWDGVIVLASQVKFLIVPFVRGICFADSVVQMGELIARHQQIQSDDGVAT